MVKKTIAALFGFLFLSLSPVMAEVPVKIGVIFARTGTASIESQAAFTAAQFAADDINSQGGVLGKKIVLETFDNTSTPLGAKRAAEKAALAGVTGVIGANWSSFSMAMADVLQRAGIPMISPSSSTPGLTAGKNFIFRVCFDDNFQGEIAADFALDVLQAETAVVMTNTSSQYSMGLASVFIDKFQERGKMLLETDYSQTTTDFRAHLKRVSTVNPDIVFVPDHLRQSGYIIQQAGKMGLDFTFLGGDGWLNSMYRYGGDRLHGNFYVAQWHYKSPAKKSRRFVKKYRKQWGSAEDPSLALTYDAVTLFADAVERSGCLDRKEIRKALAATKNFHGVTGDISFDENGDPM
ncbi:MAG TPA: ABC transporter substrate-binding protein, partial [Desulfobacteraceae bacterium]|nr:ABC transporter substrate-binding protein [Desulfobacteraceae bacterium]